MFERISHFIDQVNEKIGRWASWLTLVTILLASYNAIVRYLGRFIGQNLTSNAVLELQWYLFSLVFLLGAAYGLKHDVHVRVDVVFHRASPRARAWINLLGTIVFLIPFCLFMLWAAWPGVRNSWAIHEMSPDPGGLPRYPIKTALLVGFALLLLQAFSQLYKAIRSLQGRDTDRTEEHHEHAG
jgi:TRAP-type mannitol/chloroaromatic compound transport system permease small subunit